MNKIVILNNIRSNENVGAIFRTADASGISKIILVGYTPAPLDRFGRGNRGLIKASLGAEKNVDWEKEEDLAKAIKNLKKLSFRSQLQGKSRSKKVFSDFKIVGIEQSKNSINYLEIKNKIKNQNLALVFGNEVDGLSKADLKLCDYIAELPMLGTKESLNVSVCAGIVLYSLL